MPILVVLAGISSVASVGTAVRLALRFDGHAVTWCATGLCRVARLRWIGSSVGLRIGCFFVVSTTLLPYLGLFLTPIYMLRAARCACHSLRAETDGAFPLPAIRRVVLEASAFFQETSCLDPFSFQPVLSFWLPSLLSRSLARASVDAARVRILVDA